MEVKNGIIIDGGCMNHQKDFVMNVPYARNALIF